MKAFVDELSFEYECCLTFSFLTCIVKRTLRARGRGLILLGATAGWRGFRASSPLPHALAPGPRGPARAAASARTPPRPAGPPISKLASLGRRVQLWSCPEQARRPKWARSCSASLQRHPMFCWDQCVVVGGPLSSHLGTDRGLARPLLSCRVTERVPAEWLGVARVVGGGVGPWGRQTPQQRSRFRQFDRLVRLCPMEKRPADGTRRTQAAGVSAPARRSRAREAGAQGAARALRPHFLGRPQGAAPPGPYGGLGAWARAPAEQGPGPLEGGPRGRSWGLGRAGPRGARIPAPGVQRPEPWLPAAAPRACQRRSGGALPGGAREGPSAGHGACPGAPRQRAQEPRKEGSGGARAAALPRAGPGWAAPRAHGRRTGPGAGGIEKDKT
jgi:hypothetical protein